MKIKRYLGKDMRDAMRQVRDGLGPEAVILESERLAEGIEISAAIDFDPRAYRESREAATAGSETPAVTADSHAVATTPLESAQLDHVREEVRNLRCLLEAQVSRLVWDEQARRSPEVASVMRNLSMLGMTTDVVTRLVREIGPLDSGANTWTLPLTRLVQSLPVSERDIVCDGGIFAVVGPTGVGKTTTIAKLAARYALNRNTRDIALVTLDTYRIGAREQLETFGQIIGAPVYQATNADDLSTTLRSLDDKGLVLIDTAGMGPRDLKLPQELTSLTQAEQDIDVLLTLPANAQTEAMQEIVDAFLPAQPSSCILTKVDEASSLGGALSVLIRSGLPLAYVTNGQRVPEDLHFARSRQAWLIKASLELVRRRKTPIGEDEMAQDFAEVTIDACA